MPIYEVEVEATYRAVVIVEAGTRAEAASVAERGPGAWLDPTPTLEHAHTEAGAAWRQDEAGDTDAMTAWRERQEDRP